MKYLAATLVSLLSVVPLLAFADAPALQQLEKEQRAIFAGVAPSVVFLTHGVQMGSGFFISSKGDILTNAHVVEGVDRVEVVLHDGRQATAEVLERAQYLDLALLSVDLDEVPALALAPMDGVEVGDWVAAVGHGHGGIWTYTTGMISNIYPDGETRPLFQTQIPLNPGNSGGPVVDRNGRAIGIVTAGLVDAQAINFAIPTELALAELDSFAPRCDCLVIEVPDETPVFVDDLMVGTGPRVVIMAEPGAYEITAAIDGRPVQKTVRWPETRSVNLQD